MTEPDGGALVRVAFIDLEASSLNSGSVPIEVGWVLADGTGESHLIRPALGWTDWSSASEAVHGIGRDTLLREGKEVARVAQRVAEALRGWTLFADQPAFDQYWLDMVMQAGAQPLRRVHHVGHAHGATLRPLLDRHGAEVVQGMARRWRGLAEQEEECRPGVRHRALPDAQRLWRVWDALRRRVAAELVAEEE